MHCTGSPYVRRRQQVALTAAAASLLCMSKAVSSQNRPCSACEQRPVGGMYDDVQGIERH